MKLRIVHRKLTYPILLLMLTVVILLTAGALVIAAPTAVVVVDDFEVLQAPLNTTNGNPLSSAVTGATSSIVGGERELLVTQTSGASTMKAQVSILGSGEGVLNHSQDVGVTGDTFVVWDGQPGGDVIGQVNIPGFTPVDFTGGGTENGFQFTVNLDDLAANMTFTVYSSSTNYSEYTLQLPGGIAEGDPIVTFYVEYAAFTQGGGATGSADFTDITAMSLLINGFNGATDLQIGEIRTVSIDWGDLPDSYGTTYAADGPRHVFGGLRLGALIDPYELNGIPSPYATGDDTNGSDDEDGITRDTVPSFPTFWIPGETVDVFIEVSGGASLGGPGYVACWFDWDGGGSFAANELDIAGDVADGPNTFNVTIPGNYSVGSDLEMRCRLYADDSNVSPTGRVVNGEVEDYVFTHTPTAVTLSSFDVGDAPIPMIGFAVLAAITLILAAASLTLGWRRN